MVCCGPVDCCNRVPGRLGLAWWQPRLCSRGRCRDFEFEGRQTRSLKVVEYETKYASHSLGSRRGRRHLWSETASRRQAYQHAAVRVWHKNKKSRDRKRVGRPFVWVLAKAGESRDTVRQRRIGEGDQ